MDASVPRRTVAAEMRAAYLKNMATIIAALRDRDAGLASDLMRTLMRRRETSRALVAVEA